MAESVLRFRVETKDANAKINRLKQQVQKLEVAVKGAGGSTKVAGAGFKAFGSGAQAAAVGARGLGAALSTALGPLTAVVAAAASLGQVFGVLRQQDFAEAKVRSLGVNSKELTARLKEVSGELSGQASVLDLTGAAYDVASAGFNNAADAAKILKAASQGATGGFSDINTVGDATTSVLNAYGLEADKAAKLVDGFIQTQNDGKIVIGEYAANIAKVAPIASALGVPLEEVNAAVAQITGGGEKAEVTFTSLKNAFAQIAGGKVGKEFEKFGVEINAATLKSDGLAGTLEKIKSTGADTGEIIKAFGIEGGQAIITLLGNTEKYNQLLENQKQSQGAAAKAAFTASDTIDGQLKRLTTAFQNLFSDQSELGIIIKETFKVAAVTVEALGVALNVLLAPGRAIRAAFEEIGGAIAEAIGVDAKDAAFNLEQGFQNIVKGINNAVKVFVNFGRVVGKIIGGLIAINIKFQQEVIGAYQKFAERVIGFFTRIFDTGRQKFTELKDNIVSTVTGFIDTGIQKFTEFRDFITAALTSPADKASSVFSGFAKFMQGIFQRIGSFASGFFTGMTDGAKGTAERVTQFFGGLFTGISEIVNSFIKFLQERAPWLINALGGVGDLASGIAGAIGNALRGIRDLAVNVPGQITAAFGPGTSGDNQQGQAASDLATANTITSTGGKLDKKTKEQVDMSNKLLELNRLLRAEKELGNEREIATLELMIDKQKIEEGNLEGNKKINALEKATFDFRQKVFAIDKKAADLADKQRQKREEEEKRKREADPGFQMKKQLEELVKLENQVAAGATAIGNAFSSSFKSVITGSKSAEQALADMMASVAEHFLDMAAQIIAQQIAMILYGTIMKALGVGLPSMGSGEAGVGQMADMGSIGMGGPGIVENKLGQGFGTLGPNFGIRQYAEGGFVTGPTNAVIGEGGEPEYIIPQSKMRESMQRYSRGARGGAVIPAAGDSVGSGAGGGVAVAAPIDVRFNVERINNVDYVTAAEFQEGMQQAARQGAQRGEQQAIKRLQMSSSTRRRVGL